MSRSALTAALSRPDTAAPAPRTPQRVPVASTGHPGAKPDGPARFAAIVDARLSEPLTRAEATVLYLRIDRLLDPIMIQEITSMDSSISTHLSHAYEKLGFRTGTHALRVIAVIAWYQRECGRREAYGEIQAVGRGL